MNSPHPSDSAKSTASRPAPSESGSYSPAVPMSVYRELAAELQATKSMVNSLNHQNQALSHQNQLLRQEIHRVVQTTLQLGQYAGVATPTDVEAASEAQSALFAEPAAVPQRPLKPIPKGVRAAEPTSSQPAAKSDLAAKSLALVPKFFTEQSGEKRPYALENGPSKDVSGLWLVVSVVLIILTAFGAGFLIMRPLLNDR
ncbi:MAG: hypothetical protein F6J97_02245 [Leptolyngbya sp. SIO4C1]|nr:hypothetical protein [Leptolyngbya sp. SIO4C1]